MNLYINKGIGGGKSMSTILSDELKRELLALKREDLTTSFVTKNFGYSTRRSKESKGFEVIPPKFITKTKVHLKAGESTNKKAIDTNVGIILFNKLMIEDRVSHLIPNGFFNQVIDKNAFGEIMSHISAALSKGIIQIEPTVVDFLKDYEFYGLKFVAIFSPSYTQGIMKPNEKVMAEKDRLLKDAKLDTVQDMSQLEDKLVQSARDIIGDDPGMTLFDSGSRGSFNNDYKTMSVIVGPVENPVTNKFDFIKSNYIDGLQKEDLVAAGNIVVTSEYPKAVGTQVGGYLTKQFYAVYQSIVVDAPGTDCGTDKTINIMLTPENINLFQYQFIRKNDGKLVLLNEDNLNQYVNKMTKFRSPMFCTTDKICSMCAGERFSNMDIENIGLTSGKISNNLMNKRMKKRHNMKVKLDDVDINTLLIK